MSPKVTASQLLQLERFLDALWEKLGIDVEFTRHFKDRVNDRRARNQPITIEELQRLFMEAYRKYGSRFKTLALSKREELQAVLTDLTTHLNVPFVLELDPVEGDINLTAKTVMRKSHFKSSNPFFKVEAQELIEKVLSGREPSEVLIEVRI